MKYDVTLVRDVIVTDGSATHSVIHTETATATLEGDPSLNKPVPGYSLAGQWRIVEMVPAEATDERR